MGVVCTLQNGTQYICGFDDTTANPDDPDTTNITLTATSAYGGIDLNWTFPTTNAEAVAYTKIYRSLTSDETSAVQLVFANGNFYYDRIDQDVTYYYWIQIVSVYGTVGEMIGPAWATASPLIESMIEQLTAKIDAGMLAQTLKADIDQITLNKLGITQEMIDRDAEDTALGVRINQISAKTDDVTALLQEEVLARTTANSAFVSTVNTLYTELNGNVTAVQTTVTAMQDDVTNLGSQVTNLETSFDDQMAQLEQSMTVEIDKVGDKVTAIGALYTVKMTVNGLAGGFGIYNDGTSVEAGFDVDTFWIGRTNANKRKPFIISNDVVYIDDAAINSLVFSKLRDESGSVIVANGRIKADYIDAGSLTVNSAQSTNYLAGSTGWAFKSNGSLEINGVVSGYGRIMITNQYIKVYDTNNVLRVQMGYLNA